MLVCKIAAWYETEKVLDMSLIENTEDYFGEELFIILLKNFGRIWSFCRLHKHCNQKGTATHIWNVGKWFVYKLNLLWMNFTCIFIGILLFFSIFWQHNFVYCSKSIFKNFDFNRIACFGLLKKLPNIAMLMRFREKLGVVFSIH